MAATGLARCHILEIGHLLVRFGVDRRWDRRHRRRALRRRIAASSRRFWPARPPAAARRRRARPRRRLASCVPASCARRLVGAVFPGRGSGAVGIDDQAQADVGAHLPADRFCHLVHERQGVLDVRRIRQGEDGDAVLDGYEATRCIDSSCPRPQARQDVVTPSRHEIVARGSCRAIPCPRLRPGGACRSCSRRRRFRRRGSSRGSR